VLSSNSLRGVLDNILGPPQAKTHSAFTRLASTRQGFPK